MAAKTDGKFVVYAEGNDGDRPSYYLRYESVQGHRDKDEIDRLCVLLNRLIHDFEIGAVK